MLTNHERNTYGNFSSPFSSSSLTSKFKIAKSKFEEFFFHKNYKKNLVMCESGRRASFFIKKNTLPENDDEGNLSRKKIRS